GDRRGGDRPEMHRAVCSKCGDNCEVPFKPTGSKPIFCSKCFGENQGGDSRGRGGFNDRDRKPRFDDRKSSFGFDGGQSYKKTEIKDYKKDFEILNSKLDRVLRALGDNSDNSARKFTDSEEARKIEKAKRKEIDKKSLKKSLEEVMSEKPASEKKTTKKVAKKATKKAAKKTKKK
ncbi:MAG: hypothetical protein OEV93_05250, partial [Candidatus Moranbacteria bacterium]|nr:hypothetical protein [Candidatus Moranbacteria bacterium]